MRLLVSWLHDFVDVAASPAEIADALSLRGFEVAAIEPAGGDDAVIDFEVTANRPDCLSVLGLAREVATLYSLPMRLPSTEPGVPLPLASVATGDSDRLRVAVADQELCPRYAAGVMEVTVGQSPSWMSSRLQAAGVRPINSVVDVTNYVLIELGHPTHAFDLERLAGAEIRVRRANPGERLTTLDGVERRLDPDMLVIADGDRAQAVAGVMGGASAEVSRTTRLIALESAYFKPASVRRTSKRLNLKTEASARFERGTDIEAPVVAIQRISALLQQISSGHLTGPVIDVYSAPRATVRVHLRRQRLALLLGTTVPDADVDRILRGLGLSVTVTTDGWDIVVPSFRVDLSREADLVEEVGRHFGFDRIPATFPVVTVPPEPPTTGIRRDQLIRRVLTAAGLSEAVTFGFIDANAAGAFATSGGDGAVGIANPLSAKFDTLRPSLLPGLVDAVAHNRRHGRDDVALFEVGTTFSTRGESRAVALACTGPSSPTHWSGGVRPIDFFDVKGMVEQLCDVLGTIPRFEPAQETFLAAGRSAAIVGADGRRLGLVGMLHPGTADARGLPREGELYVAELGLDLIGTPGIDMVNSVVIPPRYPFVVRDLSVLVRDVLPADIIRGTIQTAGARTAAPLAAVTFFDRYQGKGIPEGAVSLSVRLTFQAPDRTLTDADVQASVDDIVAALVREHGAAQR